MMQSRKLPVVDPPRIEEIFNELKSMSVQLDSDPIQFGPRRFNEKIAKVRFHLDRIESVYLQVSQDLHAYKRYLTELTGIYELDKLNLMVNDLEVRQERSQKEREAKADVRLRQSKDLIREIELKVYDLEQVMIVIKAKRTDLKDIQGRMRDQMKLIDHDLSMGARWGKGSGQSTFTASNDLDAMLNGIDKQNEWGDDDDDLPPPEENKKSLVELAKDSPKSNTYDDLIPASKKNLVLGGQSSDDIDSFLSRKDDTNSPNIGASKEVSNAVSSLLEDL
jgi:uncharacterized phage infection (PIP) family protein YhgE